MSRGDITDPHVYYAAGHDARISNLAGPIFKNNKSLSQDQNPPQGLSKFDLIARTFVPSSIKHTQS